MKIFVYEYICGGGMAGQRLPDSLAAEGWAMLASIVEDFARIPGCEVVTTVDERFAGQRLEASHVRQIAATTRDACSAHERHRIEQDVIAAFGAKCDWSVIIAPETGGVLLDRVRWIEKAGGRVLGPGSAAVAIASDKFECGRVLQRAQVPVVSGEIVDLDRLVRQVDSLRYPIVLKPRDGAGSQATFVIQDPIELVSAVSQAKSESQVSEFLIQRYIHGMAASIALLAGPQG